MGRKPNMKLGKLNLELSALKHAKLNIEFKIMERMDDVERMGESLKKQCEHIGIKEQELADALQSTKEEGAE